MINTPLDSKNERNTTILYAKQSNVVLGFFFYFFLINLIFHFTKSETVKLISNTSIGLSVYIVTLFCLLKSKYVNNKIFLFILTILGLLITSALLNLGQTTLSYVLKILGFFVFFLFSFFLPLKGQKQISQILILIITLTPLAVLLFDIALGNTSRSSVFVNRNTAGFYCLTASILIPNNFKNGKILFLFYLGLVVVLFNTLGLLLAVFITTLFVYYKEISKQFIRNAPRVILTSASVIVLLFILWPYIQQTNVYHRIMGSFTLLSNLMSVYSIFSLPEVSYLTALKLGGSPENMSFLFRIKHWTEIISIYFSLDILTLFFGVGGDNLQNITLHKLRPHNDHLRLIVEFGIVFYFAVLMFCYKIYKSLRSKLLSITSIPILAIFLYMFTENLLDNFLGFSLLFSILGALMRQVFIKEYIDEDPASE